MGLGRPSKDQVFLQSFGLPQPILAPSNIEHRPYTGTPNQDAANASHGVPVYYIPINDELGKSYVVNPTNQGQRGAIASRKSMMNTPRNNPSRSQINEAYGIPIQLFSASNAWETPSGQGTAGTVKSQPSTKIVSPFSTGSPIPTRMPWDL